ncbi:hypothetical protein D3C75_1046870 [compost metagenome]
MLVDILGQSFDDHHILLRGLFVPHADCSFDQAGKPLLCLAQGFPSEQLLAQGSNVRINAAYISRGHGFGGAGDGEQQLI